MSATLTDRTPADDTAPTTRTARLAAANLAERLDERFTVEILPEDYEGVPSSGPTLRVREGAGLGTLETGSIEFDAKETGRSARISVSWPETATVTASTRTGLALSAAATFVALIA